MDAGAIIIPITLFAAIFGVFYLYIFNLGKRSGSSWKVIVINLAFLLMGIGLGVFIANILDTYSNLDDDAVYPALIFLMAGLGLYVGFTQTRKALED